MSEIYPIYSVVGIEIEYMIVDQETLDPKPIADEVIKTIHGEIVNEVDCGVISISNELACHVIELKTTQPVRELVAAEEAFYQQVQRLNEICSEFNASLLPTGAHPWFDPRRAQLWSHGSREIYHTYDRIFGCQGHGWVNLQSTHVNLPFGNEEEFVNLHRAIRFLLPIIPALTASTPVLDGKLQKTVDTRLSFYGSNQKKIPSISGNIIPEEINAIQDYERLIFQPMYQAISPFDPDAILQHEWLNSRGAIARFDRHAIEIRILDNQECVAADLACVSLIQASLKHLSSIKLPKISTSELREIYDGAILNGHRSEVHHQLYLTAILGDPKPCVIQQLWSWLYHKTKQDIPSRYHDLLEVLVQTSLSDRIRASLQAADSADVMLAQYRRLAQCLSENKLYLCQDN